VLEGRFRDLVDSVEARTLGPRAVWPLVAMRYGLVALSASIAGAMILRRFVRPVRGASRARFLRSLALLLRAEKPFHTAVAAAAATSGDRRLERAARVVATRVSDGTSIAHAWLLLPIGRGARARLVSSSKRVLPSVLDEVATACEAADARRAERWIRWSVPMATAAAGFLVAIDYAVLTNAWMRIEAAARPW
jgi:type II secretory pathway component PulF